MGWGGVGVPVAGLGWGGRGLGWVGVGVVGCPKQGWVQGCGSKLYSWFLNLV